MCGPAQLDSDWSEITCIWRESGGNNIRGTACVMAGFDDPGVYYSDAFFSEDRSEEGDLTRVAAKKRFKEFIKTFIDQENRFCYRY